MGEGYQRHAPAALHHRKRPGNHCTGDWVGLRASLNRRGNSRPPSGIDPRAIQPVASSYTDCAVHISSGWNIFNCWIKTTLPIQYDLIFIISQSVSQPVSQSISQPVSQSASQPISQSVSQPASQSVNQPVSQSANQPASQSISQPASQSVNQPASQSVSQLASQPVSQSVTVLVILPVCHPVHPSTSLYFIIFKRSSQMAKFMLISYEHCNN